MNKYIGLLLAILASFTIGIFLLIRTTSNLALEQRIELREPVLLEIEKGQSANGLVAKLISTYALESEFWVKLGLKRHPSLTAIKQGTYEIVPGDTLKTFLEKAVRGEEKRFAVALIEGKTFKQWLSTLHETAHLQNTTLSASQWPDLIAAPEGESLEGWLLPDTYFFTAGDSADNIIYRAHTAMQSYLLNAWESRALDLPLNSAYEALILASIVEKETGKAEERPLIAGVFMNRLRQKMRLQTDPTVIYGLGDAFDGDITRKHLRQATPYNTYVIKGLPPTPIAMPSRAAIDAVMHPQDTEALYFVAKGDGSHVFSTTLAEHNQAVRQYQLKQ